MRRSIVQFHKGTHRNIILRRSSIVVLRQANNRIAEVANRTMKADNRTTKADNRTAVEDSRTMKAGTSTDTKAGVRDQWAVVSELGQYSET